MPAPDEEPVMSDGALADQHDQLRRQQQAFTSCPRCFEYGHAHDTPTRFERHYICARCDMRWTLPSMQHV